MNNITKQNDRELSLIVFNTEALYDIRHRSNFLILIKETFKFRPIQLEILKEDLNQDSIDDTKELK